MRNKRRPRCPRTRNNVHDTGWQLSLLQYLGKEQRRERGRLGGFEHNGVARSKRWSNLPREHEQREIPRNNLRRNPQRARVRTETGVVKLVSPTSVGEEPGGNERDIDIPRFFDQLAVVEGFCDRKFPRTLLHEPGNPLEVLTAVTRRHPRPNGVVGATRGRRRPAGAPARGEKSDGGPPRARAQPSDTNRCRRRDARLQQRWRYPPR